MRSFFRFLLALAGFGRASADPKLNEYFVAWLKDHGERGVVVDGGGVGIDGNASRLWASIYTATKHDNHGGWVVETEFRIKLPSAGEIVEFVAGTGETREQAIADSQINFTLTTFHVVYKCFMNADDPHQTIQALPIGGRERQVAFGDIYVRGEEGADFDMNALRPAIEQAISRLSLSDEPHWLKIVYAQSSGEPVTVAATLDNYDEVALTAAIERIDWPKATGFYLMKQFIVVM